MFRNKIVNYFLNKSLKCFEKHDWDGWKRYFVLAWKFTDDETKEVLRPVLVQWFEDKLQELQSMQEA